MFHRLFLCVHLCNVAVQDTKAMSAHGSGTVTGTVGGTPASHEPEQAGPCFGGRNDFVEFFGGVSFDGSGVSADL